MKADLRSVRNVIASSDSRIRKHQLAMMSRGEGGVKIDKPDPGESNPTRKEEFRLPQKTKLFPGHGHQLILRRLEDAEGAILHIFLNSDSWRTT